jgi:hypothetical protein
MTKFCEPPPQEPKIGHHLQDWLYRLSQFVCTLTPGGGGGGGAGTITEVDGTAPITTTNPTGPIVTVDVSNMVGDAGAGGSRGAVPAPGAGDSAAGKFLKADGTWDVPAGTGTGTVSSVGLSLPSELTVSGSPVTTAGTLTAVWASETQHFVFAAPSGSSGTPAFRALVASDIPALSYVTSVGLSLPAELTVSGSPVTSSGTLSATWANESANKVFAGPTTGAAATPTFRTLVTADLPAGTGTVTSVAMTVPTEFSVSGSPITSSGTLAISKANETANTVWAGPTTGAAAQPTFRALVTADMPAGTGTVTSIATTAPITGGTITTTGTIGVSDMTGDAGSGGTRGTVPAPAAGDTAAGKFLKADGTWEIPSGTSTGSVTSISATSPIVVTPSPITTTGTISHATSGVTAASYGDSTHFTNFTVDADGHLTAASAVAFPAVGSLQGQEFTTPGANTFNVPAGVSLVYVTMVGGGGGGSCTITAATGGGGGGAGEIAENQPVLVTASGTVTVTIGAKGTGGVTGQASAQPGVDGGDTSFGSTFIVRGGKGAATSGTSGAGGGVGGGAAKGAANPGTAGVVGSIEAPCYFGGSSGAGGGSTTAANGGIGGGSGGYTGGAAGTAASSQAGGGGGASTIWGLGGAGGNGGAVGTSATSTHYGAGGGGAGGKATTTVAAGDGAPGYCLVYWVA